MRGARICLQRAPLFLLLGGVQVLARGQDCREHPSWLGLCRKSSKTCVHTPSAPNWIRTSNPPIKNRPLYQLSYRGKIYTAPAATSHKGATPRVVPTSPTAATAYFDGACITAMRGHVPARRVSLLSSQISRPVGPCALPGLERWGSASRAFKIFRRREPCRGPRDHRVARGKRHSPALGWSFARKGL